MLSGSHLSLLTLFDLQIVYMLESTRTFQEEYFQISCSNPTLLTYILITMVLFHTVITVYHRQPHIANGNDYCHFAVLVQHKEAH